MISIFQRQKSLLASIANQLVGLIFNFAALSAKFGISSANYTLNLPFYQNFKIDKKKKPTLQLVLKFVPTIGQKPKTSKK